MSESHAPLHLQAAADLATPCPTSPHLTLPHLASPDTHPLSLAARVLGFAAPSQFLLRLGAQAENELGAEGAAALAPALGKLVRLQTLELYGEGITHIAQLGYLCCLLGTH